jgi:DNA-binding transcriptional ArsR family regulator
MKMKRLGSIVLEALKRHNRATVTQIARDLDLPRQTISGWLDRLMDRGFCHICDWEVGTKGQLARVYRYGAGVNVDHAEANKYKEERMGNRENFRHKISTKFPDIGRCDVAASWVTPRENHHV